MIGDTIDGKQPAPVAMVNIYHDLQGFSTIPGGCLGFLPTRYAVVGSKEWKLQLKFNFNSPKLQPNCQLKVPAQQKLTSQLVSTYRETKRYRLVQVQRYNAQHGIMAWLDNFERFLVQVLVGGWTTHLKDINQIIGNLLQIVVNIQKIFETQKRCPRNWSHQSTSHPSNKGSLPPLP